MKKSLLANISLTVWLVFSLWAIVDGQSCSQYTTCKDCNLAQCNWCLSGGAKISFCTDAVDANTAGCTDQGIDEPDRFITTVPQCYGGCSSFETCSDCTNIPGCEWCYDSSSCKDPTTSTCSLSSTTCDGCLTHSNCVDCNDSPLCNWCQSGTARPSFCTSAPNATVAGCDKSGVDLVDIFVTTKTQCYGGCGAFETCGDCTNADGCEWCYDSSTCQDPATSSCSQLSSTCNCGIQTTCRDCNMNPNCNWCSPFAGPSFCTSAQTATAAQCDQSSGDSSDLFATTVPQCYGGCSVMETCSDCLSIQGCGWCLSTSLCTEGAQGCASFSNSTCTGSVQSEEAQVTRDTQDTPSDTVVSVTAVIQTPVASFNATQFKKALAGVLEIPAFGIQSLTVDENLSDSTSTTVMFELTSLQGFIDPVAKAHLLQDYVARNDPILEQNGLSGLTLKAVVFPQEQSTGDQDVSNSITLSIPLIPFLLSIFTLYL